MAYKFEIVDTHFLRVTDTTIVDPIESMVLDMPKADAYYDHRMLKVRPDAQQSEKVYIYDKNDTSTHGSKMFFEPITECQDENGLQFTKTTFVAWMRLNTGFNLASGSGALPWLFSATNYTDLVTNVAPTANEGELAIVYNSQGVWLVNRKLKGVYIYQGGTWEFANQELQDKIKENTVEITALEADVLTNTNNIALKRDLTAQKNSIESDSGDLQLVGDSAIVVSSQYYGTDASGVKGFHNLIGGGSGDMTKAVYDPNNVADDAFNYANFLGTFQIPDNTTTVSMSSDIDNLDLDGDNVVYLTTTSQDRRITGIKAPPTGVNRVIFFMNNSTSFRIKFVHQSGSSLADNRIVLRGLAVTRSLLELQTCYAIYNHSNNKWYISRIG